MQKGKENNNRVANYGNNSSRKPKKFLLQWKRQSHWKPGIIQSVSYCPVCSSFCHWREKSPGGPAPAPAPASAWWAPTVHTGTHRKTDLQAEEILDAEKFSVCQRSYGDLLFHSAVMPFLLTKVNWWSSRGKHLVEKFCWPFSDWIWPQNRIPAVAEMIDYCNDCQNGLLACLNGNKFHQEEGNFTTLKQ